MRVFNRSIPPPEHSVGNMVYSYPCLETDTNASTPAYDHSGPAWSYCIGCPFAERPFHPLRPTLVGTCVADCARVRFQPASRVGLTQRDPPTTVEKTGVCEQKHPFYVSLGHSNRNCNPAPD